LADMNPTCLSALKRQKPSRLKCRVPNIVVRSYLPPITIMTGLMPTLLATAAENTRREWRKRLKRLNSSTV